MRIRRPLQGSCGVLEQLLISPTLPFPTLNPNFFSPPPRLQTGNAPAPNRKRAGSKPESPGSKPESPRLQTGEPRLQTGEPRLQTGDFPPSPAPNRRFSPSPAPNRRFPASLAPSRRFPPFPGSDPPPFSSNQYYQEFFPTTRDCKKIFSGLQCKRN